MSGGGAKEGRTIPCAATSASHSAPERSVVCPGTLCVGANRSLATSTYAVTVTLGHTYRT